MLTIREVQPQERNLVETLVVGAYRQYAETLGDLWPGVEAGLSDVNHWGPGAHLLAADLDGEIAGSVAYYSPGQSDPQLYQPEWASLRYLAVAPEHRGKGVGRLLTEECLRRAREDGADTIALHTSEMMQVARNMYEAMGFRVHHQLDRTGPRYSVYTLDVTSRA